MNIWLTAGGYAIAAILGVLLLNAKEEIGQQIGSCNADKAVAISEAQEITRQAEREASDRALAQQAQWSERGMNALQQARDIELAALSGAADRERDIFQQQLDAFDEDIPDSSECLNVFVPEPAIGGLREQGSP